MKNFIRLKNKLDDYCNPIVVELFTVNSRTQLLNAKNLEINHIVYNLTEFLATINVLDFFQWLRDRTFQRTMPG
jgi:hypothetical protein